MSPDPRPRPLLLMELGAYPGRIAATKAGECPDERAFFLDFSRPLRLERWCGVWNFRIGLPWALHVPVIHHAQASAHHVVVVERADPYFAELRRLWAARYPSPVPPPALPPGDADVQARAEADFAWHFPRDALLQARDG
jgi:hypothetical protein